MQKRNVDIWTEVLPEAFRWTPEAPMSGTTKTYVRTAEELVKRGHSVVVHYDGPDVDHNNVAYINREKFNSNAEVADVVLDINAIGPLKGKRRLHQTSLYKSRNFLDAGYDHCFLLSAFHASTVLTGVERPDVSVLPLGTDFETVLEPQLAQRPKLCCYTSSPDRGLGFLEAIWPEVKASTGYDLAATPYATSVTDTEIRDLLLRSRFWLHPAAGVELYCLTAVEAQASGCIPFYVPHMALAETVRYGVKTDLHRFKDDLIHTLNKADDSFFIFQEEVRRSVLAERPLPSWAQVAEQIEKHF